MTFENRFSLVKPIYEIPEDDLVGQVLNPAMQMSQEVRIAAGFFSSQCLAQLAPGLAAFINDGSGPLKLLVSPEISEEDQEAIRKGIRDPQTVLDETLTKLFNQASISESAIEKHSVAALAYLIASERLQLRIVLMNRGMYHKKFWLFRSGTEWLAVHGSSNATKRGLLVNGEQMSVDLGWQDGPRAEQRVETLLKQWNQTWNNQRESALTVPAELALNLLRSQSSKDPPTVEDFWKAWNQDYQAGREPPLPPGYEMAPTRKQLTIPAQMVWREGRFGHQGEAVDALLTNRGGIIAIATGGGKTQTALIAAAELQNQELNHLCIIVIAPSRPLIRQWSGAIREFGIHPVTLIGQNAQKRAQELEALTYAFSTTTPRTEVIVMSNQLFCKQESAERQWIEDLPPQVNTLLIADEVHNLGSPGFIENPANRFNFKFGLSATPVRQYDPDGTDRLFEYFGGPPVFEFSVGDAIRQGCLVPYQYHLHPAQLSEEEMSCYDDLTSKLSSSGFHVNDEGQTVGLTGRVERLLRERRALLEQADSKLIGLAEQLKEIGSNTVARTLIYTSAKATIMGKPKQINRVNRLLQQLHITSHEYTAAETGASTANDILEQFGAGHYQVLTAMKVLDEGVDIPQTERAFLLASSTVEREWVQRRGRILRAAPGKKPAQLHDFLVTPPDKTYQSGDSLIKSELRRARAFAELAENRFAANGPDALIRNWEDQLGVT